MATEGGQRRSPRRVLVVSLDNIGDLVFASALLPPLRERFPSAHIAIWCKEYASGLTPLLPGIDAVYSADPFWDGAPGQGKGSVRRFIQVADSIRRDRFDTAILCFAPWRTAAAVATIGIPTRIGLERRRNRRWLTQTLPAEDRKKPVLVEAGRLLEPLGIAAVPLSYRLEVAPLEREQMTARASLGRGEWVALHPFAGSAARCVDLRQWVEVATALSSLGMSPLWIGTAVELSSLRQLANGAAEWRFSDILFGGNLTKVALGISVAKLFIGHDSGPLHIAAALGVPSVGIFAPGEPDRTFPQGTGRWRIIARQSPLEITAQDILRDAGALLNS